MSGGRLNYFYYDLEDHIGDFKDKELDNLVKDLAQLFHDREWYLSGDTCEGSWREARDAFKAKWFTEIGRKDRIEKYLRQLSSELMDSFGFGSYCRDCTEWTPVGDGCYGRCSFEESCLMHRCDCCDMFEVKGKTNEVERF